MKSKKTDDSGRGLKLVLQEMKENPFNKFNIAFALMSMIPFLVFVYILSARLFTLEIFVGDTGLIMFISMVVSLLGLVSGYTILKGVMNKIMYYAAKAKSSDETKSAFVASIAHELKNPLSVIKMSLSNLSAGIFGEVSEKQKQAVDLSQDVIDRMTRLISDLLDLHKMESGKVLMNRSLCDIPGIVEKQVEELTVLADKKNIKVTRSVAGTDLFIWADEDKLSRVVNNLLSNAIKYTPETGFINVRALKIDGFIRMEVEDTAPVIPEESREDIFDKFKRLKSGAEGTGLGLAITRDMVELHKGKVWAEGASEKGNRFVVILPSDLRGKAREKSGGGVA